MQLPRPTRPVPLCCRLTQAEIRPSVAAFPDRLAIILPLFHWGIQCCQPRLTKIAFAYTNPHPQLHIGRGGVATPKGNSVRVPDMTAVTHSYRKSLQHICAQLKVVICLLKGGWGAPKCCRSAQQLSHAAPQKAPTSFLSL